MCTVCGCGVSLKALGDDGDHHHHHDSDHHHGAHGDAPLTFPADGDPLGPLGALHAPGMASSRIIEVEHDLLAENNRFAAENRKFLAASRILGLNLMSSPGSGKTSLLVRTIADLQPNVAIAVIEGDQQTSFDADRIRAAGAATVQINTGRNCHLDAHMVGHALARLKPRADSIVFIENVGNLVCPSAFDLGEASRVVMLSVTEGDDKPLKYPDIFAAADMMVVTKVDLLPHVDFSIERCIAFARRIRPAIEVVQVSAKTGEGLDAWYQWIVQCRQDTLQPAGKATRTPSW
jgi:hydrogenase nickel incorporation protein HypB